MQLEKEMEEKEILARLNANFPRAVMNKPPILLCDEPTGNLDSKTSAEVIALLLEVTQDFHMTLILVTHDRKLADKMEAVITIQDGRIGGGLS